VTGFSLLLTIVGALIPASAVTVLLFRAWLATGAVRLFPVRPVQNLGAALVGLLLAFVLGAVVWDATPAPVVSGAVVATFVAVHLLVVLVGTAYLARPGLAGADQSTKEEQPS
jgi:hypothetical protein